MQTNYNNQKETNKFIKSNTQLMKTILQSLDFIKSKAIILVAFLIISAGTSFTQVTLVEGFESGIVPPSGWTESGAGYWVQNTWGNPHTGSGWAYSNGIGSYLITPAINVTTSFDLSFWYKAESVNHPQDMDIMVSTDPNSFVDIVHQITAATNTSYIQLKVSLAAYVGQTVYVAFVGQSGLGGYDYGICLDDVMVYGLPICATLNTPANSTSNVYIHTNLSWTGAPLATGYKVYLGTDFPPSNIANGTDVGPGLNYTPPTPFSYSTLYYWSVISYNSNGDAIGCATWSFTTEPDPTVTSFPWTEEFLFWPPTGWNLTGGGYSWESYGSTAATCDFWSWTPGGFAELTTQNIDLTQQTLDFNLTFKWSHLYMTPWPNDQLEVLITEVGSGTWTSLWLQSGPGLNSNDGATAHAPGTYIEAALPIPSAFLGKMIQIKFIGTSGGGPEFFLDNVTISALIANVTSDEACEGFSGTLIANPFAGIPPYTYVWSEGSITQAITVSPTVTTTYTVTITDATTNTAVGEGTMNIHPTPIVTIINLDPEYCINAPIVTMFGNHAPSGSFVCTTAPFALLDNGDGTATFDPAVAFLGTHQITYTYVDPFGCTNYDARSVEVLTLPVVSFSGLSGPYCASTGASELLTGSPLNGTFSGAGMIDHGDGTGTFDPEFAGPGVNHSITYTYVDPSTGCSNYDQQYVTVLDIPAVDAGMDDIICEGASSQLTVIASGGFAPYTYLWDPAGSLDDPTIFNPIATPPATTTYIVTVTDANGCSNSDDVMVTVNIPVATVSDDEICIGESATLGVIPSGGSDPYTFSWTPVAYLDDPTSQTPVSTPPTPGDYIYTVVITDAIGCTGTGTLTLTVHPLPVVDFAGLNSPYCANDAAVLLTGNFAPDGTFTGTGGLTDNGDGTATFDPVAAGPGNYEITYTYTDANTCTNSEIKAVIVNVVPIVNFSGLDPEYCVDWAAATLTGNHAPGGSFIGAGITNNGDGTATFLPATAGVGTFDITYTYTNSFGCTDFEVQSVIVHPLPIVTLDPLADVCINTPVFPLTGGLPLNGIYSGPGVSAGDFTASIAGLGTHTITYSYTDIYGCIDHAYQPITVHDTTMTYIVAPLADVCVDDPSFILAIGFPTGGVYYGPGVSLSGSDYIFDPATAGVGTHTLFYAYTNAFNCTSTVTTSIVVNPLPIVSFTGLNAEYCVDDSPSTLTGTPAGGYFTGAGTALNEFYPDVAGPGTHNITYTYTDPNGCTDFEIQSVIVYPLPIVTLDPFADVCIDEPAFTLTGGLPVGGVYSGTGVAGTDFDPAVAGVGTYIITYTYTDANTCVNFATQPITVNPLPPANAGPDVSICYGDCSDLTATGGTVYSWDNGESTATINVCPTGSITYIVTVTDVNGCSQTDDVTVNVWPLPIPDAGPDVSICLNECTTLTATGGVSYMWNNNMAMNTIDVCPTVTTTYTVTVTDANGCSDTDDITVTVWPLPIADAGLNDSICLNDCTILTASGGTAYVWNTGDNTAAINVCPAVTTTYTVTVTDANGCTDDDDVIVTVWPLPTANAGPDVEVCIGECTIVTATGGDTYLWNTGSNQQALLACPTVSTTYTVTVTDVNGCTDSDEVIVIVNPIPIADAGPDDVICFGECTALSASGGIIYIWSNNNFGPTMNVCPAVTTTYTVTVTDINGCTDSDEVIVTVNPLPPANAGADVDICFGSCSTLTASGGTIYLWNTGETTVSIDVCPVVTTTYTVTVTDANGCVNTADVTVNVQPIPVADAGPNVDICDGDCTNLTASGAGAGGTYVWNDGSSTVSINVCPIVTTTYSVTVTDIYGCTDSDVVIVSVNPVPVADAGPDATVCDGDCTTLMASGGVSYLWSNNFAGPVITVCPSITTTYTVTVTDANGCSDIDNVTITVNPLPPANAGADVDICFGSCSTLTASGGTIYLWNTGETTASIDVCPVVTTTYTVTVIDANGCVNTADVIVNVQPIPVADAGPNVDICDGDCTNLTASGAGAGGTYVWNDGSSTVSINVCPIVTTTYSVTVTDIYGCTDSDVVIVSVNPVPIADAGPDATVCDGDCVTLMASGGVSYMWSNNFAGPVIVVCPSVTTTFTVTVTDANGCSDIDNVTVTVNPLPPANAGADVDICFGDCATLTATGGTAYIWSTGANTAVIDVCPVITTTYFVTVTDANGCINTDDVTVTVNPLPLANAGPDASICNGDCVTLTAFGAGVGGSYIWNTGGLSAAIYVCPVVTTTYSVTITNANGCTDSDEVIVVVNSLPSANAGPDVSICEGDCTTLTASGGIFYQWSNNVITQSIDVCPTITTTYTVTITDANGCTNSDDVIVTVIASPVVTFATLADLCVDAPAFILTEGTPSGGIYSGTGVSGGSFDPSIAGVGVHTLTYTYTDITTGCSNFATQNITVNPLPLVYFAPLADVCLSDAQFTLTQGLPSTPAGVYTGTGIALGTDFSPFLAGVGTHTLTYTYTDLNGCISSATQTITVNPMPVQFTVTGGGNYCAGGAGVDVGLMGSELGVDYNLIINGITTIATFSGTGAAISFGNQTIAGAYTVFAYNTSSGCEDQMIGSVDVGVYPLPIAVASSNSPVCGNDPIMLYSSGGGCSLVNYCPSTSSSYIQEYITNVSLNNASQASVGNFYTDFTANIFTILNIGGTYTLSVTNYVDGTFPEHVTVFIDWNRNGIFEAADSIYMGTFNGTHTFTKSITVPPNALLGKTLMRVINQWGSKPIPCGAYGYGETEDYQIEITDGTGLTCAYAWAGPNSFSSTQQNPIVTDSATMFMNGIYTVTVTDINLCVATASVNVVVNALPLVNISGLDTAYCLNDLPVPLSGSPVGGSFSGTGISGTFFYPAIAGVGTHTVTYTYDNGNCVNKITQSVMVRDIPQMTLTDDFTICQGDTVQLTASGGTDYFWSTSETTPSIMVYPNNTTVYHVTVANIFGCSVSDSVVVSVNPTPIVNAGNDDAVCLGSSTMLNPVVSGGGGVYNYQWTPATGLDDPNIQNPIASPVDSTYYVLTVVDLIYGCIARDTVLIEVYPVPAADAGPNDTTCFGHMVTLNASPPGMTYLWSTTQTNQTINVVAADTAIYFVTVTNAYGCSAIDSVSVIANPVPFGDAGDNETICFGDLVKLEATGGGNYEWLTTPPQFTQSIIVNPNDTTEYHCVVSNVYGCTDTASVWVFVNPLPVITITATPNDTVCKNQKVILDAGSGFDTYLWSNGDTTQVITIDSSGVGIGPIPYQVIVTKNGCDALQEINITFEDCIGIDDHEFDQVAIDIYPNPTTGRFNIAINGYENDLNLTIFNNIGQIMYSEKLELNRSKAYIREFDLSRYKAGIYFLRFNDGKMTKTKKIIIQ